MRTDSALPFILSTDPEFPEENPTIEDVKQYYSIGESLEANCTSNSSIPPAKLEWFVFFWSIPFEFCRLTVRVYKFRWINDLPLYNAENTIKYNTIVDSLTNRETSILGIRLPLTNEHFYLGRVKVSNEKFLRKCLCSLLCNVLCVIDKLKGNFVELNNSFLRCVIVIVNIVQREFMQARR